MKTSTIRWFRLICYPLVAALALLAPPGVAVATAAESATLTGQVSNAATGAYLEGANVTVEGTGQSAVTDRQGRFWFSGVPAGQAALVVRYGGLDTQRATVNVGASGRTVQDVALTSQVYQLEKFTVSGEREGTARSEAMRRAAPNVMNIISADTFGNRADANIANLLENVAGISANYNDLEARQVSIRGVDSNMNSVSMDGQQMASSAGNANRNFLFDQMGLGNIESIEVTKSATPDMEGSSVGGGINLVTKSAFDRMGIRQITYSAGFTTQRTFHAYSPKWKQPVEGYGPFFNLQYTDVLGEKRNLGIAVTVALTNFELTHNKSTFAYVNDPNPDVAPAITNWTRRPWSVNRTKYLTGVKLDYRWSDNTTITTGLTYNYSHILNSNPGAILSNPATFATVDAAGNRTGGGQIAPGSNGDITRVFPAANTLMTLNDFRSNLFAQTVVFQPSVKHRFDTLHVNYGFSYSDSKNATENPERAEGNTFAVMSNIGWTLDRTKDGTLPTLIQTAGPSMYNLNNYNGVPPATAVRFEDNANDFNSRIMSGKLDVRKDFPMRFPVYLKSGLSVQEEKRDNRQDFQRRFYVGPDGIMGTADDSRDLGQFLDTSDPRNGHRDFVDFHTDAGGSIPFPNSYGVARHVEQNPSMWLADEAPNLQSTLLSRRKLTERISAAYIMGNVKVDKFGLLTGVRFEETRDEGDGPLTYLDAAERARRAAWGTAPVTTAEAVRRVQAQFGGRQTNSGKYDNVLPSAHLRYEPIPGLLTRLSWSTGIGRPNFGSIIPLDTIDDNTARITRNNPNLKPQEVDSYDFVVDYFFKGQGSFTAGIFRKDIKSYIFSDTYIVAAGPDNGFEGEYVGYTVTTQSNRGSAKIEGLEFSYSQQFTFLPGWSKGLGVHATFTKLKTVGDYGGSTVVTSSQLAGFVPKSGSIGLTYRGYGLELRLNGVFYGEHLLAANLTNPLLIQYRRSRSIMNWKSKYNFSRKYSVFFDVDNFTAEPAIVGYIGFKNRQNNWYSFEPKIQLGVGGTF